MNFYYNIIKLLMGLVNFRSHKGALNQGRGSISKNKAHSYIMMNKGVHNNFS